MFERFFPSSHKDAPYDIYSMHGQPHVLIRQSRSDDTFSMTNRTSGFLVFADDSGGAAKLKIALLPATGTTNIGLLSILDRPDGVAVEPVDWKRLPAGDIAKITDEIQGDVSKKISMVASESGSFGGTLQEARGYARKARKELTDDHNLVAVRKNGDDDTLSQTLAYIRESGLATDASWTALNAAMNTMQNGHFSKRTLKATLDKTFDTEQHEMF